MIIFIIPKNSGLEKCREIAKEYSENCITVRGEDVPLIASLLLKEGKKVLGITGEDLFKEFLLNSRDSGLKIVKRIAWSDSNAIYGKPTLCLLGPKNSQIDSMPKSIRIVINSKYKEIAKKYCTNILENQGYRIEKIYASGATEEFFTRGIVNLVIDIVVSGKSAEQAGLKVYNKLFESDIVIIGDKNE